MFLARKRFWLTVLKVFLLAVVTLMIWLQIPELNYDLFSGKPLEITGPDQLTPDLHGQITYVVVHGRGDFEWPTTRPATRPATQVATGPATRPATGPATQVATGPATQPATRPAARPGKPDLSHLKVFRYKSHAIPFTYFLLEGYGPKLLVRTAEAVTLTDDGHVTKDWLRVNKHFGRLRRVRRMPFSRTIRRIVKKQYGVEIGDDAFFLARDDVPKASGWQIGAITFAVVLWFVLLYFFFFHKWTKSASLTRAAETPQT